MKGEKQTPFKLNQLSGRPRNCLPVRQSITIARAVLNKFHGIQRVHHFFY